MTKHGLNALLAVTKQTTALIVHTDSNITASTDNVLNAKENDVNKQKEIEEMAEAIDKRLAFASEVLGSMNKGKGHWIADGLSPTYRKADEVRKETAQEIFSEIQELYEDAENMVGRDELFKCGSLDALNNVLDIFCQKFGLEVNE